MITSFKLDTSHGKLSATLNTQDNATHMLLLAHGAGADHQHAHMQALSVAFNALGINTLRFNFSFKEAGKNRVDSKEVSVACIEEAAKYLDKHQPLPLLLGGHSFGGRMSTHTKYPCTARILCSFPLHPAGKPDVARASHLTDITEPILFLSGNRDSLADQTLMQNQISKLGDNARLHWLDTADHSFKVLKRSRKNELNAYQEAATAARTFLTDFC